MTSKQKNVGIVGYGQMGRFLGKLLRPTCDVRAWDPRPQEGLSPLAEAAGCDFVFLFPPIHKMGECCEAIREHLRPGAVVIEGCSVMTFPVEEMRRLLPANVDLVGSHPLFGPQSGASGVAGLKLVLSAVRTSRLDEVIHLFDGLGLDITILSPEEHDRAMARTQALEQLIGRMLVTLDVDDEPIDVPGYRKLVEVRRMLEADSEELFRNVQLYNPFAEGVAQRLEEAVADTLARVRAGRGGGT
jgi:prephenate dehydrogenase